MIEGVLDGGTVVVPQVQAVLEEGRELAEVVGRAGHMDVRGCAARDLSAGHRVVVGRALGLYVEPKQAVVPVPAHVAEVEEVCSPISPGLTSSANHL